MKANLTRSEAPLICFQTIGYVDNEFDKPVAPELIRAALSRIRLDASLVDGLRGLEPGQQLIVIFHFHLANGFALEQHPKRDTTRRKRGVFALRSPNRPNPIGVTTVNLLSVKGAILHVTGLDAINGTPVLDLKPA